MSKQVKTQSLDKGLVVVFDTYVWSATKKLTAGDLRLSDKNLPPEAVASLGSKRIFDPQKLTGCTSIVRRAHVECEKVGTRFLSGYFVPATKIDALIATIDGIKAEFEAKAASIIDSYDADLEAWLKQFPGWETALRMCVETKEKVATRLRFEYQVIAVQAAGTPERDVGLISAVDGLAAQMFLEVEKEAQAYFAQSIAGKQEVGVKAIRPLRHILDKLDGLSFLDPQVVPVTEAIKATLAMMPSSGKLDAAQFQALQRMVLQLSDVQHMLESGLEQPVQQQEAAAPVQTVEVDLFGLDIADQSQDLDGEEDADGAQDDEFHVVDNAPAVEETLFF